MCGISGYNGSKRYDPLVLKLLNMFNQERGDDSIGIINDNAKFTGIYQNGKAWNFQQTFNYETRPKNYTVLQHNRARSTGVVDLKSTHPYVYEYDHEGETYQFFFMHNGTLRNSNELGKHYGVNYGDYHTDSHMLGDLILKKGFEPLEYYTGGAALAFYWEHEPNSLFLFKGASNQSTGYGKNQKWEVGAERPLFYSYVKNGLYFASIDGYLEGCGFDNIEEVPDNTILKFVSGEIVDTIKIERKTLPQPKRTTTTYSKGGGKSYSYAYTENKEQNPTRFITDKVVYYNNKYYYNGVKLEGMFCVKDDYSIDDDYKDGEQLCFYDGFWVKDLETWGLIREGKEKNPNFIINVSDHLHPECLVYTTEDVYYYGGKKINNKMLFKPKFAFYYYKISASGYLVRTYHAFEAIAEGLLNKTQFLIEKFNALNSFVERGYHLYLSSSRKEVESFIKKNKWNIDLDDIIEWEWPIEIIINKRYENIEEDKKEDTSLREFNMLFFGNPDEFTSKKDANAWHITEHGEPYNINWSDEEVLQQLPFDS